VWLATQHILTRDMTYFYVWCDSFLRVTWLVISRCWSRIGHMPHSYVRLDSFLTCDMTHSSVWCYSSLRVSLLILMCDMTCSLEMLEMYWVQFPIGYMTHSCMRHDSFYAWCDLFLRMTWLILMYVWHNLYSWYCWSHIGCSFWYVTLLFLRATWLILTCDMTCSLEMLEP